jgi:hypothetical protein
MGRMKDLSILIDESTNDILDHLDLIPRDRLTELMNRISFELQERDYEAGYKFKMDAVGLDDIPF